MPQKTWSAKRERQYEHIKDSLTERGRDEGTAEEIAARTVNKARARAGEAANPSRLSLEDLSSGRREDDRGHRPAPSTPTASSLASALRSRRDTCIWLMPVCAAISLWVISP